MAENNGCRWSFYCIVCPPVRKGESVLSRKAHVDAVWKSTRRMNMAAKKKASALKPVIVRTYSAGVHFGYLDRATDEWKERRLERDLA